MRIITIILLFYYLFAFSLNAKELKKPNVILIVSDDHGYADFSFKKIYDEIKTPNLDQLTKEGISFSAAYVTAPICSPSRVGLITGQYQQRNGNYFYGGPGVNENVKTLAQGFKSVGYSTAYFGKLHYGRNDEPNGFGHPINHGFDESITAGVGGRVHYLYHNEKAVKKHSATAAPWFKDGLPFEKDGFTTEIISDWAQEYIATHTDHPFFLQVAFNAVHNFNFQLPKAYLDDWNLPYYPDYQELQTGEKEASWYDRSILPKLPNGREYYAAQLYYLDKEIGEILAKLKHLNLDENTIIVYMSDNGGSNCNGGLNTPLRGTKYSLYEGGIRIPLIMKWGNNISKKAKNDYLISTMDIMPTVLAAAGADPKTYEPCDGINLMPYLTSKNTPERDELVWDVGFAWAVQKDGWKLKVVTDISKADIISKKQHTYLGQGIELYNLHDDLSEKNNVANLYPEIVDHLSEVHDTWKNKMKN